MSQLNENPPAKRTYFLDYMGSLKVHRLYTKSMLHWVMAEVKCQRHLTFCSLTLDQKSILAKKEEKMLIDVSTESNGTNGHELENISPFSEPLAPLDGSDKIQLNQPDVLSLECSWDSIVEMISPNDLEKHCVGFLRSPSQYDAPYTCHVFYNEDKTLIKEVSETMNKNLAWHRMMYPHAISNGLDQEFDCIKFEVMMLGKIQVKQEYPPNTFIDEAVEKYHSLEQEHILEKKESLDLPEPISQLHQNGFEPLNVTLSLMDGSRESSSELLRRNSSAVLNQDDSCPPPADRQRCSSIDTAASAAIKQRLKGRTRHCSEPTATSKLGFDKNKIKLLQIGRQSLILICPDQSARRIEVQFTDIIRCSKGVKNNEHFGIFAKDHNTHRHDEFKFRCYLFKCADESVCDEIMLAMKQSCSMCAHGPDPFKSYHALCKKINLISGATSGQVWVEHATNIAAKFMTENLSDQDLKRTRNKIDECCKNRQASTKYEQLVVVMTVLRCFFLDRQHDHDMKLKQLKDPNAANAVSKRLNFFKSRAKKSLSSFESFFEKGFQRMHELQHEAEHHIQSPIEKLKFFDNPRSSSPSSSSIRSRNQSGSPHSGTEMSPMSGFNSATNNNNNDEATRPRSNTVGSVDQSSIIARRKLNMSDEKQEFTNPVAMPTPVKLKPINPALSASNSSLKRNSFSSPFLRRLTPHLLEDVQESPSEGVNAVKLTSSRFSLSRLFGIGESQESPSREMKTIQSHEKKTATISYEPPVMRHDKMFKPIHVHESHESDDEDDHGIFFVAKSQSTQVEEQSYDELCHEETSSKLTSYPSHADHTNIQPVGSHWYEENEDVPWFADAANRKSGISSESTPTQSHSTSPSLDIPDKNLTLGSSSGKKISFHQEIFIRISGSSQKKKKDPYSAASPALQNYMKPLTNLQTPDEVRYAWRRAIRDQMILNRINNIKTLDKRSTSPLEGTLVKLRYDEVGRSCAEMDKVWDELLSTSGRTDCKMDPGVLHAAVKRGVSKNMRGEVWSLLHEQWKLRCDCNRRLNFRFRPASSLPYNDLLKQLTPHQHAILIDLGRTFPTHPYFNQQLRTGQLDLFNLLKAYSLVDPEVGYCQGLSFVAGIILMHMSSSENAFKMLNHLMMVVGCRSLFLPDMEALKVSVYQLSRLLHDFHRDLYDHFESNDVSLMLFSTPWFLTMFASVLSFGFTARIFDLLFLEGKSALFKAAMCLLGHHKQNILNEDTFEGIVCYMKNKLPEMKDEKVNEVLKEFFEIDIGEKLQVYEVEFAVMEDGEIFGDLEVGTSPASVTKEMEHKITRLEHVNQTVTKYNLELAEQLEAAKMQINSLQQGLTDMVAIDEKKSMELEALKHENQVLKRSCDL